MKKLQYACDQCRKSKRGCNAPPLDYPKNLDPLRDGMLVIGEKPPLAPLSPCSNCIKTNKTCTMIWAWTQIQCSYALAAAARGDTGNECLVPSKQQEIENSQGSPTTTFLSSDINLEAESTETSYLFQSLQPVSASSYLDPNTQEFDLPSFLDNSLDTLPFDLMQQENDVLDANFHDPAFKDLSAQSDSLSDPWDLYKEVMSELPSELQSDSFSLSQLPDISPIEFEQSLIPSSSPSGTTSDRESGRKTKRRRVSTTWSDTQSSSLSSFSIDQSMMKRSNDQLISSSLLQIYHDVLEHNLSCWLVEATCPFGTNQKDPNRTSTVTEWGSSWTNRILRRTLSLDRVAKSTQLINISKQEDTATAKALHLSIMAFATQWAQGSCRQRERYSSLGSVTEDNPLGECLDRFTEEFDRNLQRNIWDQARRALNEVADVESFRVVCAEMIFGLTQKPLAREDSTIRNDSCSSSSSEDSYDANLVTDEIAEIIENDGIPTFMERAARKMFALKYRFDAEQKDVIRGCSKKNRAQLLSMMNAEDQGTISLLYWLTIMFDTISSTMAERPLVVADVNSQHKDAQGDPEWNIPLFIQDSLEKPSSIAHWPCSYEEAAEAVIKSAPVKVLLFRHVAYLQNILRHGVKGEKVRQIIKKSASIYRYWNMTYGAFFGELLQNYDSIPSRIQSWFICISAHWHLGALLLADLIEYIDRHQLSLPIASQNPTRCNWVTRIRERSAKELSDLARVATPSQQDTFKAIPQHSEFHHAINEAMILTEPWTVILIRAFSKAANYLLSEANDLLQFDVIASVHDSPELQERLTRAEDCIKGLWFLGKKSDVARRVADTLSRAKTKLPR